MNAQRPLAPWLDRFFTAYYEGRPVNATFIGVHDHDHRLPEFSENGSGDVRAGMETLLRESEEIETAGLTGPERLDLTLARGFLRTQIWEYGSEHFHRGNPSTWTGEAAFGVIGLFLTDAGPRSSERVAAATARMEAIPGFLEQGRRTLHRSPRPWTERALRECAGARAFFTDGIERLAAAQQIVAPGFKAAAARAAAAFEGFASHLARDLPPRDPVEVACGEEALHGYLRHGHFLEEGADETVRYAEDQLAEVRGYLRSHAADFGAVTPEEALGGLDEIHPAADRYLARYHELSEEVRERTVALDLLTWPESPIRFVPTPDWARAAAPYLYFLPYRAPAAFGWAVAHDCLVPALEGDLPPDEQERFLRSNNDSVLKLNYVVHHGGIGHHVQNAHARQARSQIGRVAAVDCASRIAFFCGGTMAEGWACYATDLAGEAGLLTPLELYAEQHTRLRMCARAVVDVRLHRGRLTLEEGARYYERHAGMSEAAARAEVVKNSMFPGAAVVYVMGTDAIHRLRRELSRHPGFRLRAFHDELLSYGSVPVALVAAAMTPRANDAQ